MWNVLRKASERSSRGRPKVVVITGASAGVGRAVARRFAEEGTHIGLIARGVKGLEATACEVRALGGQALVLPLDVASPEALEEAAQAVEAQFGPIDIWINAAFAGMLGRFLDMSADDFRRVTDVTYLGQVNGVRAVLPRMMKRDRGVIVLVGSALAYRGIPLQSAYCAAKHALQGFQDSLRSELIEAGSGVKVTMVQLPGVNTPQFDWIRTSLPRLPKPASPPYQPEVAAQAIHFAAHHPRKELVVGFPSWQAIVGDRLASPWVDRYLAASGVSGQQDEQRVEPGRPDNLYEPVEGDRGAHGRFDDIARKHSPLLWASMHRGALTFGIAAAAGAFAAAWSARGRIKA
jgi:NAD(P)-dependent dehydrogenase (short-subunit alcohol dehydrogenase family)